jgi:hypothetical protein
MVRFPTRVGARVVHGATRERECRALRARLYDCVGAEAGRTGAQRHPGVRVALLGVRASDASLKRASDVYQPPGNVSVHVCAGVGVGADADAGVVAGVDAGGDADAGGDVDAGDVGVGVGAYGCGDASGCDHGCDHADVGSLLSFEEVVEAALLCLEEEEDGPASVDAGAGEDGSGGTDWHACVHTVVVHAGGVHQDQDAMVPTSIEIVSSCQRHPKLRKNLPEYKGSPHAKTRHQACVVQVLGQLGGYDPTHRVDELPSLENLFLFPSPFPALALALVPDPYLCPSHVVASSRS